MHFPGETYNQRVYGIKIPSKSKPTVFPEVVLVPLVCFHPTSKHRIGYGGGYYDAYIAESRIKQRGTAFVGVAFECMKTDENFWEHTDQALDFVITEESIY